MNYNKKYKIEVAPRPNILREEKIGECYKSTDSKHYYLVRENDVLHVGDDIINTLYDNTITHNRLNYGREYISINRSDFNQKLNNTIFNLDIYKDEYKNDK